MPEDNRKLCLNCAWRANCAKRFSMGDCATLHCPDYCEDVALRKQMKRDAEGVDEDGEES